LVHLDISQFLGRIVLPSTFCTAVYSTTIFSIRSICVAYDIMDRISNFVIPFGYVALPVPTVTGILHKTGCLLFMCVCKATNK